MALSPLNTASNSFPLSVSPYHSRVSTHAESVKNYTLLGFNPGFALQAAELNEIQELFFLNQNLTQRMNANWIRINNGQLTPFTAPYWEGLIPLSPDYVTVSTVVFNGTSAAFNYSLSQGWYLYTDSLSKLSFWVWNENTLTGSTIANGTAYFGLNATTAYVNCCQTDDDCTGKDSTLRDASQSFYQEFTCGSSRFQVNLGDILLSYDTTAVIGFAQIFTVNIAARTINFPNNYVIHNLA